MKNKINFVSLVMLGFFMFPSIARADVKKIDDVTYSRVNIDYTLNDTDYTYMYGVISPTEFIIYNDDLFEYEYLKNGSYRDEKATLAEIMKAVENKSSSKSMHIEYTYNDKYEILKKDHKERITSDGKCYRSATDITAKEGVTYYIIEEFIDIIATPVAEFNVDDVFHYHVETDCIDKYTGDKLTQAQIIKLDSLIKSVEEENAKTYADKFNVKLNVFLFFAGDKYVNVFETRYTETDIDYNNELYDPSEFTYVYSYYDLDSNKIEELNEYRHMNYLEKSNLIVAKSDSNLDVLDTNFNVIFTDDNPYKGYYNSYNFFIFDIDANRLMIDYEEGKAVMITRYMVLDGEKQTYDGNDLKIRINGEVSLLDKIYINDVELATDNYIISEGSTIITLKDAYLKTLSNASYTLKATYKDGGFASATFIVNNENSITNTNDGVTPIASIVDNTEPNPNTSDSIISTLVLAGISLIVIIGSLIASKKKEII